jgi:hypothetical protein
VTTQTATIPTSPQLKRRSHWKRNTGIGGGAFLILLIGIGARNPTPPSGTATGSATAPTVAAGPQVAISGWYTGGGQTHLNAITDDLGAAHTAAAGGNVPALNTACTSLQGDIEAAQPYPAVPDPQAQADWSTGLAQYARAAPDCVAGISTLAPNLINQGVQEMNAGSVAIKPRPPGSRRFVDIRSRGGFSWWMVGMIRLPGCSPRRGDSGGGERVAAGGAADVDGAADGELRRGCSASVWCRTSWQA